jgi:hypothetical protein
VHCTIAGNRAGTRGGGFYSDGEPFLRNSIVYENSAPEDAGISYSDRLNMEYVCLQEFYPGLGNLTNNPLLAAQTYALTSGSPAIDAGTPVYGRPVDLLHVHRPLDGTGDGQVEYDLGAYEFVFSPGGDDQDNDGLPDGWEEDYFGSSTGADPADDPDADGLNNLEEYVAGTDPTNAASFFAITNTTKIASGFVLDWSPSTEDRVYSVLWSDALSESNSFEVLESNLLYPKSSYTDTTHQVESEGFYKVEVKQSAF